jgi:AAA+ superfamily predicted ATPase
VTIEELNVSQLQPVHFRKNAWDRLVLDSEYKDIVRAMVSSYVDKTAMLDDLVAGKGGGLVALLHGPPGSGKTLTAECVADSFERPLYQVTCGDIGTDPGDLEDRLEEIFDYAVTWDAILLLDEADIFLQDRDYTNLERNALVSIFLRTLEYFNGVLFLTTNRVGTFDQAFQSRIHVTLGLPSLDQQRRISVWAIFLQDLAAKGAITDSQHQALTKRVGEKWSKEKLNGRQIRNTVRTALVLAEKKGAVVGEKDFETVLKIGREFEGYMGMLGKGESNAGLEGFQEV